jgi:pilus assembly protein CpaC
MAPVETATQDSANDLSVAVGKSVLVDFTAPIKRAAIGQSEVAEVTATSSTELMINGKTTGQTSLIVWEKGGERQFFNVTVRSNTFGASDKIDAVRRELSTELPGQPIKISAQNGSIFLRGNAKDLNSADRAVAIASTLLTTKEAKVVNLLYVDVPPPEKQIMLKVRFASIDRTKAKSMGVNLFDLGLGNALGGISTGQFTPPQLGASAATSTSTGAASPGQLDGAATTAVLTNELNMLAYFPGLNAGADIEALETQGVAEVLAEPNVVAMNGKQASFLAGGEYPFPVAQSSGAGAAATVTIQWKEYGVRLNFIPTITPRGTIRLQVAPEVSALDFADAVEVSGTEVPALTVRRMNTEAELADGQSFVIGGLLDNTETESFNKVPFLGDIPILGKLFQSMSKNRANTELIVIVTPEFIDPIPVGGALPELKFPVKFLPPNSGIPMNNPDAKPAGETPVPAPDSIPVEKLVDSNKPEQQLVDTGNTSGGMSSGGTKP